MLNRIAKQLSCWVASSTGWVYARLMLQFRRSGHVMPRGGVLLVANHQSFLDPVLIGVASQRRLNYMARRTLFRKRWFAIIMRLCGSFPVDREGLDVAGIKDAIRRLRWGEGVVIFPEGTRTDDGSIGALKSGFGMLARRAGVPIQIVVIDGAYQAWPRGQRLPRRGRVQVVFGEVISLETVRTLSNEKLGERVYQSMTQLQAQLHGESDACGRAKSAGPHGAHPGTDSYTQT